MTHCGSSQTYQFCDFMEVKTSLSLCNHTFNLLEKYILN